MPGFAHNHGSLVFKSVAVIAGGALFAVIAYVLVVSNRGGSHHGPVNCSPNEILVNPCRPWLGAAVGGNTQAPADRISQFNYLERQIGHRLDIFHDFHPVAQPPLNADEIHLARSGTYIYADWKPANTWAAADGGNAQANREINRAAASIKAIAPHRIFLTLWQEPQHSVSGGTACPIRPGAAGGTPAQYRAMWRNVEQRFKADGVTNVVWVMDYQGSYQWACLVPSLWPGNNLVDWVTYDTYSTSAQSTWANTVGLFYQVLLRDNSRATNFTSKPWGVAEFGACLPQPLPHVEQYFLQAKAALDANMYSRLKMYMVYDSSNGPNAGPGCLTDYSAAGSYTPEKQAYFNKLANDPIFTTGRA
jgi:hypothetical protein